MGLSIIPVDADDDAALARFCALEPSQGLTPRAVRLHAPDATFLAQRDDAPEGRCSAWWTSAPRLPEEHVGVIGHYVADGAATARQLLDAACERLRHAGCTLAIGPMDGSTWRRYRLLSWRGEDPLFFLEPDNPDSWPAHFTGAGFAPLANYYSSKCDDLAAYPADERLAARLARTGYRNRPIDPDRFEQELGILWRLAADAFAANYLYTPISEPEFRELYAPVLPLVRPELVRIAEHEGRPVGFLFGAPDVLQASRGSSPDTVILKTLGVLQAKHGRGLGDWLIDETFAQARRLGFRKGIFALMHEGNVSRRMGHGRMRDIRRYTLYARRL